MDRTFKKFFHITVRPLREYFDQDFPTLYLYGDFTTFVYKYPNTGAVPNWKKKGQPPKP